MLLLTDKTKSTLFLVGIVFLFVGLTLSKAVTSLVTVYFLLLFLIQREYKNSFSLLKKNKSVRYFLLLVIWMSMSLLWSDNKSNGIQLFISNLNFFIWPVLMVLFSEKVNRFQSLILLFFTLIVAAVSLFQFINFQFLDGYHDLREMSLHVSHIRFALMVAISFFIGVYFFRKEDRIFIRAIWLLLICWFLFYTYYSQVLSGVLGIIGGLTAFILYITLTKSKIWVKVSALAFVALSTVFFLFIVVDIIYPKAIQVPKKLDKYTSLGNEYETKINSKISENGHILDLYYCEKEVDSVWKLRSTKPLDSFSPRGYTYKSVLKRFLTSKGLRKDAFGVKALSIQDIKNIEKGIPSVLELENGLLARYYQLKFEFTGNLDPNGHSILQRFEFWKASKIIIIDNWFLGVGLGSSKDAFSKVYKKMNSKLLIENQWESHNQFLSIWISFGIIGLFIFCFWLFSIIKNTLKTNWLYTTIFGVLIFSFFAEDTLSTLVGMTLFAFYSGFFQNLFPLKQE